MKTFILFFIALAGLAAQAQTPVELPLQPAAIVSQDLLQALPQTLSSEPERSLPALTPAPAPAPTLPTGYALRVSDLTIRAALERWLKDAGYQSIVWDLREDLPIDRNAYFEGDLQSALRGAMVALRNSALPTRACIYTNMVVRIIPATRFCSESTQ